MTTGSTSKLSDVKIHKCFPTIVYQFSHTPTDSELEEMKAYVSNAEKKVGHIYHTEDTLYQHPAFQSLTETVLEVNRLYLKDLDYEYEELEITSMWANKLQPGDPHPPHTHSNNVMAGAWYLQASEGTAPIQFFDPRPQATILTPRNKPNWENAGMLQFDSVQGVGHIFPAWIFHWVPPTQEERISIAWNILLRGHYGEADTYQNAHI